MGKNFIYRLFTFFCCAILFSTCEKILPPAPADNELLDGPIAGLNGAENARFLKGDIAFNDEIFTTQTGLGPLFVATSCGSCHAGDGKGTPFTTLTRFGQVDHTGNRFLHLGGPQLQHRAVLGIQPESIPAGATFAKFTPPANTGLGFLDFVSDEDILAFADPEDTDGNGISGKPNWVTLREYLTPRTNAISRDGKYIGRFGKKAAAYDLLQQTANAYNQDMGITSNFEPHDTYSGHEVDPEVSNQTIQDVVFYLQTLKTPLPRNLNDPLVSAGKQLFQKIQCAACHRPELKTGYSPAIPGLASSDFF